MWVFCLLFQSKPQECWTDAFKEICSFDFFFSVLSGNFDTEATSISITAVFKTVAFELNRPLTVSVSSSILKLQMAASIITNNNNNNDNGNQTPATTWAVLPFGFLFPAAFIRPSSSFLIVAKIIHASLTHRRTLQHCMPPSLLRFCP